MQADPNERSTDALGKSGPPVVPIVAGVVVVVALAVWMFFGEEKPTEPVVEETVVVEVASEPEPPPAPDIPEVAEAPVETLPPAEPPAPKEPPPTLENSDEVVREQLAVTLQSGVFQPVLQSSNLLERGAALVDGLSRGVVRHKLLPLPPPAGKFPVKKVAGKTMMDPAGYARYDEYAEAIEQLDTAELVNDFREYRLLLEEAYGLLGYDPLEFDNALIQGLDRIIATPVIEQPIEVKQVEAVYKYTDPQIEKLAGVQKQLLRMGPENVRRIKQKASALRAALLAGG